MFLIFAYSVDKAAVGNIDGIANSEVIEVCQNVCWQKSYGIICLDPGNGAILLV